MHRNNSSSIRVEISGRMSTETSPVDVSAANRYAVKLGSIADPPSTVTSDNKSISKTVIDISSSNQCHIHVHRYLRLGIERRNHMIHTVMDGFDGFVTDYRRSIGQSSSMCYAVTSSGRIDR